MKFVRSQSFLARNYSEKESSQEFAVGSRAMAEKSLSRYSYFYTHRNSKKVLFLKLSSIRNILPNVLIATLLQESLGLCWVS